MYSIKYVDGEFWIAKDERILEELGSFIDPISPEIIIKEIEDETENNI